MKIALDFDQTFTADPLLWEMFIFSAKAQGHDIRIVTARDERFDRTAQLVRAEEHCPVVYTRGIAKRFFCTHFMQDFIPDVWIDDKPESILQNSPVTPEALLDWRLKRGEGYTL